LFYVFFLFYLAFCIQIQSGCKGILNERNKKRKTKIFLRNRPENVWQDKVTNNGINEKVFYFLQRQYYFGKGKRGITTIYFRFLTNDVYTTVPLHIVTCRMQGRHSVSRLCPAK
jgi:hypothetical protein